MVTADIDGCMHLTCNKRTILSRTDLQCVCGLIAAVVVHVLLTALYDTNRPSCLECKGHGDEYHRVGMYSRAEMAAARYPFDVYLVEWNIEQVADQYARVVQGLCGRPKRDSPVRLRPADA